MGIITAHGLVPALVVTLGARLFFGACRVFPPLFGLITLTGIGVGVWLIGFAEDADFWSLVELRLIGVGCLIFYGGLLTTLIVKLRNGTWGRFCRRCAYEFGGPHPDDQPAVKAHPTADSSASGYPPAADPA
ncbi:MAG: hypothetical protein U0800_02550 [Isosphaeraceae bacterium]